MWTLTADDIHRAKVDAMQRRSEIESSLEALNAELKELEDVEKSATAFIAKYQSDHSPDLAEGKPVNPPAAEASHLTKNLNTPTVPERQANNWGNARLAPTYGPGD